MNILKRIKELKIKLGEETYQECFNEGVLKGKQKLDLLNKQKQDSIQAIDKESIQSEPKMSHKRTSKRAYSKKVALTIQKLKMTEKGLNDSIRFS